MIGASTEVYQRIFSEEYLEHLKTAFKQLKADPSFQYRYNVKNQMEFYGDSDDSYGVDNFPAYKDEFTKDAYDSFKMTNTRIICDKEDEEAVVNRVYEIFNQNKLYELQHFALIEPIQCLITFRG